MPQPTEIRTLAGTLESLKARGFTTEFTVDGGRLKPAGGGPTFLPGEVTMLETHRFEGVSDPDDMAILYGLETATGLRGTLVDAFGVYADPGIGDFMKSVVCQGGDAR